MFQEVTEFKIWGSMYLTGVSPKLETQSRGTHVKRNFVPRWDLCCQTFPPPGWLDPFHFLTKRVISLGSIETDKTRVSEDFSWFNYSPHIFSGSASSIQSEYMSRP